jgi:hypothetical protein
VAIAIVLLQAYLGFTFLGAAYGKARTAVGGQEKWATATWSLVVAEILAGFALLVGVFAEATALAVTAFLAVGVATKAFRRWRNARATCGCVGERRRIDAAELMAGCVQVAAAAVVIAAADGGVTLGSARAIAGAMAGLSYLAAAAGLDAVRPQATWYSSPGS